jgi:uncharacterized membrane protein
VNGFVLVGADANCMTTRVFGCPPQQIKLQPATTTANVGSKRALAHANPLRGPALAAIVVVPLAGAAEAPNGWLAAALSALVVLCAAAIRGSRIKWGWMAFLTGGVGLLLPRGAWGDVGPPLFTATLMCLLLWIAYHRDDRHREHRRAAVTRRAAQMMTGLTGERHVERVLARELPDDFALINGLTLPNAAGDIDHLVVGPTGLFVLETKTLAGQVVCAPDGTWHRTRIGRGGTSYAAYIGDPAAQVQRNIYAVRQALRRHLPDSMHAPPPWIEGLLVFAHPRTDLQADQSRVPAVLVDDLTLRICTHSPRRRLQPKEVDAIVAALLVAVRPLPRLPVRQPAQALVELALLLPVVLVLVFGTIGMSRYVQTHAAVVAVAHEAARAGALASSSSDAIERMRQRAQLVAPGFGLDARLLVMRWDVSRFGARPGEVEATIEYPLEFGDLPMVGAIFPTVVRDEHREWVDPFRSGIGSLPAAGS